ncbi:polysaccharide pyruvyl transferase CsaB [Scopulibacillus darangshiensis]|uniref:Polysaccharide pyruvyl transferase CsaB n=1 Tax=Scopulibacillus darangshiensis TaxID=442528 RepID=A0A4R2NWN7_9BACL|nr:polysaccharide pyruvyl transferase CsaB [Scopulibacillus darangshiensis]TCP26011.1 polysaccharide pyruvyl transferase CsaB [Scopulibacillus darangshiensis]
MKVVISGFYGFNNAGDEAILKAMIDNLKMKWPELEITVLSFDPRATSSVHDVKSLYRGWRRDTLKKMQAIKNADVLISGGGGLLQDTYPTKVISGPLPYYLIIVMLAKLMRTKVMFFSQGIGPINTRYAKSLMKLVANRVDLITVRDQHSKGLLKKLGIKKPQTIVTADIVFSYLISNESSHLNNLLRLPDQSAFVAVSVRPWFDQTNYYGEFAKALDILIEKRGITPIFIPMENHHDYQAAERVISEMSYGSQCRVLDPNLPPNDYISFIKNCHLMIGMRLHALIFSALAAVPFIGVSYDNKVENFLKMTNMWDVSCDLNNINAEAIAENAMYLLDQPEMYIDQIQCKAKHLRQKSDRNLELLDRHFLSKTT